MRRKMKRKMRRRPGERLFGMPIRERWTWNQDWAPTVGAVEVGDEDCEEPGDVLGRGDGEDCEGFGDEEAAKAAAAAWLLVRSLRPNSLISLCALYSSASYLSRSSFNLCLLSRSTSSEPFKVVFTLASRLASASQILRHLQNSYCNLYLQSDENPLLPNVPCNVQ